MLLPHPNSFTTLAGIPSTPVVFPFLKSCIVTVIPMTFTYITYLIFAISKFSFKGRYSFHFLSLTYNTAVFSLR